jgi:hypothetical protein
MSEKLEQEKVSNAPYDDNEFHDGGLAGPEPTAEERSR